MVRQPRVPELIADALRRPILNGELQEGDSLPRQEDLMERFEASLTSVREALRILELEGLVTIRRGNVGGSVVRRPTVEGTAYNLGLLLQSRATRLADLAETLSRLEPYCARLCAERADRKKVVVPVLAEIVGRAEAATAEPAAHWNATAREFHRAIVRYCGGDTVAAFAESLVLLWSAHEASWMRSAGDRVVAPSTRLRTKVDDAHADTLEAIRAGDGDRAEAVWRSHLGTTQRFHFAVDERQYVDAGLLHDASLRHQF